MDILSLVASVFIVLHNVDGDELLINSDQVAMLRVASESVEGKPNTLIVKGVNCLVGLSNGRFIGVVEECPTVRRMLEGQR